MDMIEIGGRNIAPSEGDARHHWFYFSLNPNDPEKPFVFSESLGGGHGDRGGQIALGSKDLPSWAGDWREHVAFAGCAWVQPILEEALRTGDQRQAYLEILKQHYATDKSS